MTDATLLYLDANVFVFAALDKGPKGEACRNLLRKREAVSSGTYTSTLTVDEVVWALKKAAGKGSAVAEGRRMLAFAWLRWIDLTVGIAAQALDLVDAHGMDPRDALHSASAMAAGCDAIASDDPDFDHGAVRRQRLI